MNNSFMMWSVLRVVVAFAMLVFLIIQTNKFKTEERKFVPTEVIILLGFGIAILWFLLAIKIVLFSNQNIASDSGYFLEVMAFSWQPAIFSLLAGASFLLQYKFADSEQEQDASADAAIKEQRALAYARDTVKAGLLVIFAVVVTMHVVPEMLELLFR